MIIFSHEKLYLKVKNQLKSYADEGVEGNELLLAMKKDFPIWREKLKGIKYDVHFFIFSIFITSTFTQVLTKF